jgi:site-specific recombinase XerD
MLSATTIKQSGTLASIALNDAYTDFVLSRQAMQCTKATMEFYRYTTAKFLEWAERQGVNNPQQIDAYLVRQYIAELAEQGKKDTTLHDHARAIRTLMIFWHEEGYTKKLVKFAMPRLSKKRLPVLSAEELTRAIETCKSKRDKALLLFLADSGLRRSEVCSLNWEDVDMQTGLVMVKQGKGRKDRSAVISPTVRRALLAYRRTLARFANSDPLFLSRTGQRLTGSGVLIIFRRLSKETGIHITPHALRRTFVILSLRAGMDVLHLQAMLGHTTLDMVQHYAQMEDEDLLQAHKQYSPIEGL